MATQTQQTQQQTARQTTPQNQLAVANDKMISDFLIERRDKLVQYAIRGYDANAFVRSAFMAISQNRELQACLKTDDGRDSLYNALRLAASTGLSLNPQEGKAALVAYNGIASYQIMKNGLIELALASGQVEYITSDYVCEHDTFFIEKKMDGDGDVYRFSPALTKRGPIIGFFAAIKLTSGKGHVAWMTTEEIDQFRATYARGRADNPKSPWNTSFSGMGIKTVIKKLLRSLNLSPDTTSAIIGDDISDAQIIDVTPVTAHKGVTAEEIIRTFDGKEIKTQETKAKLPEKQAIQSQNLPPANTEIDEIQF
jgi:phage RecT family recombinase